MDLTNHPCFNVNVRKKFGRVHLPVAPKCNVLCNFCNRKFDCVNESRPGVSSSILSPRQALAYLDSLMERMDNLTVTGIAGPGDPFANPEETMETMRLIRAKYPEMILCVATNGLNLSPYVKELSELKVSHVTITVNAIDPHIGSKIYSWYRHDKRPVRGVEGANLLLSKQIEAIELLKEYGVTVKINSIIIPGINEHHIVDVARFVKDMGVDIFNAIPMYKTEGSVFENLDEPDKDTVFEVKKEIQSFMPLMHHCVRCRADAVGCLDDKTDMKSMDDLKKFSKMPAGLNDKERPYVAVASYEGLLINQHLGEARELFVFGKKNDYPELIEKRETPAGGRGVERWKELSEVLNDCSAILVSGVGNNPRTVLENKGIEVMVLEGMVEEALQGIYNDKSISHMIKRTKTACGESCSGTAAGCG